MATDHWRQRGGCMYILLHRKVYLMFLSVSIHLHCVHLQQQDDVQFFSVYILFIIIIRMLSANYRSTSAPKTCRSLVCKLCVFVKNFLMWRATGIPRKNLVRKSMKNPISPIKALLHQVLSSIWIGINDHWRFWSRPLSSKKQKPQRHSGSVHPSVRPVDLPGVYCFPVKIQYNGSTRTRY